MRKLILLICFCKLLFIQSMAQETMLFKKVSVDYHDKPLTFILKDLEEQSGIKINFSEKMLDGWNPVSYEGKNQEIGRILTRIIKARGLNMVQKGGSEVEIVKLSSTDEFKIKSEQTFEFIEKPKIKVEGEKTLISFETKGFCDATVAIEDLNGKVVRHLASGVLGDNAPLPFQWNTKKQTIEWDGKDDQGNYVTSKNEVIIRVSLGLKPKFERTLLWDLGRKASTGWGVSSASSIKANADGVYVYDPGVMERLRLFDHNGNYVRTIYPFPSDKLDEVKGLITHTFPHDGKTLPFKGGFEQSNLLLGKNGSKLPRREEVSFNATSLAVNGNKIAIAGKFLGRLGSDGSTGGLSLSGPKLFLEPKVSRPGPENAGAISCPTSSAFSPDGKWLYLTGYMFRVNWHFDTYHGVNRIAFDQDKEPELFAGSMTLDGSGTEDGKFLGATSVACDPQGRVYVTDYCNDRVQIFSSDGKFLKSIKVFRPAIISINPKNSEIYVFSWMTPNRQLLKLATECEKAHKPYVTIEPKLFKLGTFDNPSESAGLALPLPAFGGFYQEWWTLPPIQTTADIDFYSETPTIWISQATGARFDGKWDKIGLLLLREKNGKMEIIKDFGQESMKNIARSRPPMLDRQRLYVNPKSGKVYVGEADSGVGKSFGELLEVDPESGNVVAVKLPYTAEDMAFDINGFAYLRSDNSIVRYDSNTWKEIPWDYGDERQNVAFDGQSPLILSSLSVPGTRSPSFWHMGGIYVNAMGHVAVHCPNAAEASGLVPLEEGKEIKSSKPYAPKTFAGRLRWGEIHIWDRYGKLVYEDVFPGIGHMNGIGIDNQDNVYVMANGTRLFDGKPYDPNAPDDMSETLMKTKPRGTKALSSISGIGLPISNQAPKRVHDFAGWPTGNTWIDGSEWMYGGVGYTGLAGWDGGGCRCWNARFCLDYFARSFAPETRHFSVAVLDSNGNLITRIGKYGNVDDGKPIVLAGGPQNPRSIGGDEVGLFHAAYLGTISDKRLFIADAGNARMLSVKLAYSSEEKIELKGATDIGKK